MAFLLEPLTVQLQHVRGTDDYRFTYDQLYDLVGGEVEMVAMRDVKNNWRLAVNRDQQDGSAERNEMASFYAGKDIFGRAVYVGPNEYREP